MKRIYKITILNILKFLKKKPRKKRIPYKDSIRPVKKFKSYYPEGWVKPLERICQDGTIVPYGFNRKLERIPCSDAIDNSF